MSKEGAPSLTVLVVEDDRTERNMLTSFIRNEFPQVTSVLVAESFEKAQRVCSERCAVPEIAILDHDLAGDEYGSDVARWLLDQDPHVHIVVTTGYSMRETMPGPVRVYEEYEKLSNRISILEKDRDILSELRPALVRAVQDASGDISRVLRSLQEALFFSAPNMRSCMQAAARAALGRAHLLILGERGVGKTAIARALHTVAHPDDERGELFVQVNCPALDENLLASELFGHEKGAFTGAHAAKPGLFETANGGTIFLDEIGEISLRVQLSLLQVLQDGSYRRTGSNETRHTSARVIAATNCDLRGKVARKEFRDDLYDRLNVFSLTIPPLRQRKVDIVPIAEALLKEGHDGYRLSEAAKDKLRKYDWPANVRELKNAIDRATVLADGKQLGPHLFSLGGESSSRQTAAADITPEEARVRQSLDEYEKTGRILEDEGRKVTWADIGRKLDPPMSGQGVSKPFREKKSVVLSLFQRFPGRWPLLQRLCATRHVFATE